MLTTTEQFTHPRDGDTQSRRVISAWSWFMLVAAIAFWSSVGRPLRDPDIWWHVRTGDLILDQGLPREEPWAFTALGNTWVPTAWLSDVVLAVAHAAFGWWAIIGLKLAMSALLLWALGRELLRCGPARIAALVYPLSLVVLAPFLAERPQLVSLVFTVWLTRSMRLLLMEHRLHWSFLPLVYLWANLHGMWVLAPLALGVASIGLALDRTPGWARTARRSAGAAALSVLLAGLTPVGPRLAYWSIVVRDAAQDISEWQPTRYTSYYGMALLALFGVWVIAVARSRVPTPRSEVLWMVSALFFSTQAGRNLAPSAILMAPFAVLAAARAWEHSLARFPEPRFPRAASHLAIAAALVFAMAFAATRGPLSPGLPDRIVSELKSRPGPVRVLNSYNVGGYLTGMGAPKISVAIDGRTDNYDASFVHRYLAATSGGLFTAQKLIDELNPDVAVLGHRSALARELQAAGWKRTLRDGDFVLLDRP